MVAPLHPVAISKLDIHQLLQLDKHTIRKTMASRSLITVLHRQVTPSARLSTPTITPIILLLIHKLCNIIRLLTMPITLHLRLLDLIRTASQTECRLPLRPALNSRLPAPHCHIDLHKPLLLPTHIHLHLLLPIIRQLPQRHRFQHALMLSLQPLPQHHHIPMHRPHLRLSTISLLSIVQILHITKILQPSFTICLQIRACPHLQYIEGL